MAPSAIVAASGRLDAPAAGRILVSFRFSFRARDYDRAIGSFPLNPLRVLLSIVFSGPDACGAGASHQVSVDHSVWSARPIRPMASWRWLASGRGHHRPGDDP